MFSKDAVANKFAVLLAEFFGTGALTFVFLRMQYSSISLDYFIAIAVSLALAAATFAFASKSGAHFNPAVTIGMWSARQIKTLPAVMFVLTQMFAAWTSYELFNYFYVHLAARPAEALYQSLPAWDTHVFLAEAFGALVFSFVWAAALHRARGTHALAGYIGVGFGVGVLIASMAGSSIVHSGVINPAVAEGLRVFHIWSGAAWGTYVLGPVAGGIVGFNIYQYFFAHDKVTLGSRAGSGSATASASKRTASSRKKSTSKKR